MKTLMFILLLSLVLFNSCLDEGSNYLRYTGLINIDQLTIADSAKVGDTVFIKVKGGAPNGCWSGLKLNYNKQNDSLYYFNATGTYESTDGICTEVYQIIDSTFTFKPTEAGLYRFIGQSANDLHIIDTLVVIPAN